MAQFWERTVEPGCAALRYEDILDEDGTVRSEIRLDAEQTKGR